MDDIEPSQFAEFVVLFPCAHQTGLALDHTDLIERSPVFAAPFQIVVELVERRRHVDRRIDIENVVLPILADRKCEAFARWAD